MHEFSNEAFAKQWKRSLVRFQFLTVNFYCMQDGFQLREIQFLCDVSQLIVRDC